MFIKPQQGLLTDTYTGGENKLKFKFHRQDMCCTSRGLLGTIPASPGHDQIRVDLANEILSSGLPAVKASYRLLVTRLLLLFRFRPGHANVLGQEVNEHLQKRGGEGSAGG